MPFDVILTSTNRYFSYLVRGGTTVESLLILADRIALDSQATRPACVLLDCAAMTGQVGTVALFRVGEYYAEKLREVYLAAINAPPHWTNNDFCENVIHNRHGELRHFPSREAAEEWFAIVMPDGKARGA